jgi:hypothetical protein
VPASTSRRWLSLKQGTELLRGHFLPDPFDPVGQYPNPERVQAYTRAFLVLSHAEIESYLEGWAKDVARAAEAVWVASARMTPPLAFLLSALGERITVPDKMSGKLAFDMPQRLVDVCSKLFQKYYKQINDNNGVKEKNVLALFCPLGLPTAQLNPTLLPNLDSIGSIRGTHAHNSAKAVVSLLDPESEYQRVSDLVADLSSLDQWLTAYRRRIR